jgi:hypothetical protein
MNAIVSINSVGYGNDDQVLSDFERQYGSPTISGSTDSWWCTSVKYDLGPQPNCDLAKPFMIFTRNISRLGWKLELNKFDSTFY